MLHGSGPVVQAARHRVENAVRLQLKAELGGNLREGISQDMEPASEGDPSMGPEGTGLSQTDIHALTSPI